MSELLAENTLWITDNQSTLVLNFHQDFRACTHSDFLKGQTAKGLIYRPDLFRETQLSN
jgi:hypothetical protein